ncbi:2-hydroxyacyl-CoA dehydratase family protein [Chloroflexota bacterium]
MGLPGGGLAKRWIRDVCKISRDLGVDGIVNFWQVGCTQIIGFRKLVADAVEAELGIPSLDIEGRISDALPSTIEQIHTQLAEFVEVCAARKGLAKR